MSDTDPRVAAKWEAWFLHPKGRTMPDATTATAELERRQTRGVTLFDLIARQTPAIEAAIGSAVGAERFARIVTTEVKRTPKLLECVPETVLGALMLAAQLDLEPGPLGHAYLVPFRNDGRMECQFIVGYTGMLQLAWRSGLFKDVTVRTVYEGDLFRYREGLRPQFEYEDCAPDDRGAVLCYAGLFRFRNGGSYQHRLWPTQVEATRKRSPAGRKNVGPWQTDYDAMARKTVVRAARPWLPLSALMARALVADESAARFEGGEVEIPEEAPSE